MRVLLSTALLLTVSSARPTSAQPSLGELLTQYANHSAEVVARLSASAARFEDTVEMFERDGQAWARQVPQSEHRRRLLAATFALDVAASVLGTNRQVIARRLFVSARDLVRPLPVDDDLRTWHLASVALIERAAYWDLFNAHMADAAAAMPNDARLAMASAMAAEAASWLPGDIWINQLTWAPVRDLSSLVAAPVDCHFECHCDGTPSQCWLATARGRKARIEPTRTAGMS